MDTSLRIGLVEDNEDLRSSLVDVLKINGFKVTSASSAEEIVENENFIFCEVMIIDLNLPGEDGLSLTVRLKKLYPRLRIIMMTARSALEERIIGYDNGADLYLVKPIMELELIAALKALARQIYVDRTRTQDNREIVLQLKSSNYELTGPNGQLLLTYNEAKLLTALASAPGSTLEYWQLLELLKLELNPIGKKTLAVRLTRLRTKLIDLGCSGDAIKAIRSDGYHLCVPLLVI